MTAVLGILLGVLLGNVLPLHMPPTWSPYVAIGILAALDAVLGGMRASAEGDFHADLFVTGFMGNALLALGLTYIGGKLDTPLYMVTMFAFGARIFGNFGRLRRTWLDKVRISQAAKRTD